MRKVVNIVHLKRGIAMKQNVKVVKNSTEKQQKKDKSLRFFLLIL